MRQLWLTKRTTPDDYERSGLRQVLTATDLALLGIGAIIGAGIFVLTGIAAATQAGPAVVLSFVVSGTVCCFAALAYAELAASIGGCGSAYGYSYAAFGELFAWIIGWDLILEYGVTVAAVANGWSGYFINALQQIGIVLPASLTKAPSLGGIVNLPAAAVVFLLMVLLALGVRGSARTNHVIVAIKLVTIGIFVAIAAFNVNIENWTPFLPYGWFEHTAEGKPIGVFAGAALVFFAYIGFDAVSTAAEEARDPRRDLPIGIMASLAFCTIIYIIVAGLLTGLVPYTELNVASPVAHALELKGFHWASGLVAVGAIAGLLSVMLVCYYGLTRVMFAMARDGLLPPYLETVHSTTRTPVRIIVITGLFITLVAGFLPLGELAELVNIGTLAAFTMVCVGVVVLRRTRPDLPRPFVTPWSPLIPVLGALSCFGLMTFLPAVTWYRFVGWLVIGLVFYFAYSMPRSKLAQTLRGAVSS